MNLFKGKSASERNKMIAAILLGVLAVAALGFAFFPRSFSSGTKVNASVTTSPKPANGQTVTNNFQMPSQDDQNFDYASTAISYSPGSYGAPDPGRNIFAFFEPPPPTPYSPTPVPINTPKPTPTPTPFPYQIAAVMPQSVYAGQRTFKLEVIGEGFEPDTKIYFSQSLMPTSYLGPQRLTADIPANLINSPGGRQVILSNVAGTKQSEQRILNVQAPPTPQQQYEYVGMISRKFANNDTAYFMEKAKLNTPGATPTGKRLNDLLAGRFRLISISEKEAQFEDVNLGFKHKMPILRQSSGGGSTGSPASGFPNFPNSGRPTSTGFPNGFPGFPNVTTAPPQRPNNANRPKKDEDDDDDDTDN